MRESASIAAIATSQAPSALGLIRCSGPLSTLVFPGLAPRVATVRHYKDTEGHLIDQVVAVYYERNRSFTGEASLELSCHGNPFILKKILEDLCVRGFALAAPGEFTRRAFINGKLDLTQAEAIGSLIAAQSDRALAVAHRQLSGELGAALRKFSEAFIALIAATEATIDFPEEDVPVHLPPVQKFDQLIAELNTLRRTHHAHALTFRGVRVVLAGAPNAGKSSLFNALLGHSRALVSSIAGTTRDYIEASFPLGGHLLHLIDTAGLNPTAPSDSLETRGMEKTQDQLASADIILWVYDGTLPAPALPACLSSSADRVVILANKSDDECFIRPSSGLEVSATQNQGLEALRAQLLARITAMMPHAEGLMVSARHAAALEEVVSQLHTARTLLLGRADAALIAHHLRSGLDTLGEILGKFDNEKILDSLFGQFCIGK